MIVVYNEETVLSTVRNSQRSHWDSERIQKQKYESQDK